MTHSRGFASDNNATVHPKIMEAIMAANRGHVIAYGDDPYTEEAVQTVKSQFDSDPEVFFVFTGTAANVLSLEASTQSWNSIICAESSHIHEDECGAPEKFTGAKLIPVETPDGKLTVPLVEKYAYGFGFEHHSQPRVVSITQVTEMGTIYTPEEIRKLADYVHARGMILHMDGARIANAAVSLGLEFREFTEHGGVDVLSFGGTKNGMMFGEAVIFFNKSLATHFKYIRKQGMHLASKMRYIAAQFTAYFQDDLWRGNATHANKMAQLLAKKVSGIKGVELTQKVQANGAFARVPAELIEPLQEAFFFYIWDEKTSEVRWMCSWDTTEEDIDRFAEKLKSLMLS